MHVEVRVGQVGQRVSVWLPASPRVTRSAPMAWALCAPAGARGSRVTASRYALGAEGGGAARPGAYMCSPRNCARCLRGGEWGCRRRRALRAAREARCKACFELLPRARVGWHTTRTSVPPPTPCSSGVPIRWLMARGRRASGVAAAPRSHAAGAPTARRWRAVGGACACRARSNGRRRPCGGWVVVRRTSQNYRGWLPRSGEVLCMRYSALFGKQERSQLVIIDKRSKEAQASPRVIKTLPHLANKCSGHCTVSCSKELDITWLTQCSARMLCRCYQKHQNVPQMTKCNMLLMTKWN